MKIYPNLDTKNARFNVLKLSGGNYLIAIACGAIDAEGLTRIFRTVLELSSSLPHCKVLIDFEAATLTLQPADVDDLLDVLRPELGPHTLQIAVVSSPQADVSNRLCLLRNSLCRGGSRVAVFHDIKSAVGWLRERL
jgi:hypothetical protein